MNIWILSSIHFQFLDDDEDYEIDADGCVMYVHDDDAPPLTLQQIKSKGLAFFYTEPYSVHASEASAKAEAECLANKCGGHFRNGYDIKPFRVTDFDSNT